MKNCQRLTPSSCGATLLACVTVALLFAMPSHADVGTPFKITSFVSNKDGSAVLQWQGADRDIVVQFTADVTAPVWQPLPGVEWPVSGTNWSGVIPTSPGKGFLRVVTTGGVGTAPIPLKTISLTLIGWHDPKSDKFYRNCIACHGTRTQEPALDGKTPAAHSKLEQSATLLDKGVSRRSFLKMTSTLAAGTAFAGVFFRVDEAKAANFGNPILVDTDPRARLSPKSRSD